MVLSLPYVRTPVRASASHTQLLYYTSGVWVYRYFIYATMLLELLLRLTQGICRFQTAQGLDGGCGLELRATRGGMDFRLMQVSLVLSLLGLLVLSSFHLQTVLPWAARRRWLRFSRVREYYNMKLIEKNQDGSGYKYEYSPSELPIILPFCSSWKIFNSCSRRAIFSYAGTLDSEGRPHGIGRWRDTQGKGETLKGLWVHGKPMGPFAASEQGSGFGFRSVQIGFATCCGKASLSVLADDWDQWSAHCKDFDGELKWGIAATETSINGHFYKHLPESVFVELPGSSGRDARWVLDHMTQMRSDHDSTVIVTARGTHEAGTAKLSIAGFEPDPGSEHATSVTIKMEDELSFDESSAEFAELTPGKQPTMLHEMRQTVASGAIKGATPILRVLGWSQGKPEALVFIHGWNAGHKNSHQQLAQFLNLSRLGPHVKPFIFSWPSGSGFVSFPQTVKFASDDEKLHKCLAKFFESIAASGIRNIHVCAHSMGSRLFCSAFPEVKKHLVKPQSGASSPQLASEELSSVPLEGLLELTTVTLLHPEHALYTFIERDYDELHAYCKTITMYMDRSDGALKLAEFVNNGPELGMHPYALVQSARQRQEANLRGTHGHMASLKIGLGHRLRGYDDPEELSLSPSGANPALDIDVIDTSWMDTNTQGPRHSYFHVNRWLIDDLAEVITTRKRAASRPHRLVKLDVEGKTRGNVWAFLAAPSWIGS